MNKPRGGGGSQKVEKDKAWDKQEGKTRQMREREGKLERRQAVEKNREQVRKQARGGWPWRV